MPHSTASAAAAAADYLSTGHASWSFTTENGVTVEIGRSIHRPGYGVTYGGFTYGR